MNAYCEIHSGKAPLQARERLDSIAISDIVNKESWREIHAYQKVKPAQILYAPSAVAPVNVTQTAADSVPVPSSVPKAVVKEIMKITSKAENGRAKSPKITEEALSRDQDDDSDILKDTDRSSSESESEGDSESER